MIEIRAQREPWRDGVELLVIDRRGGDEMYVAQPIVFEKMQEGEYIANPTAKLKNQEAQMLIDELWRCGLRPSEGSGSAGSLAATERHLKDMQAVALGLLRKDGVQV